MLSMNNNTNISNVVKMSPVDLDKEPADFDEAIVHLKFWLIESFNLIDEGKMEFTEETKKNLRLYNRCCYLVDEKPLKFYSKK